MTDDDQPRQPIDGFHIICKKCRSDDIHMTMDDGTTPEEGTGYPAELRLICRACGNRTTKENY